MDIRQIVDTTLVAPMREQSLRTERDQLALRVKTLEAERTAWREAYLSARRTHEHFVGELHERFQNKAAREELLLWDEMADMVRTEHFVIHGPSDGNAG